MTVEAELLTARDVMVITQLSRTTVYQLLRSRQIPTVKWGKRVFVRRETLRRWITDHEDVGVVNESGGAHDDSA